MTLNTNLAQIAYIFILSVAASLGLFMAQIVERGQLLLPAAGLFILGITCRFVVPYFLRTLEARSGQARRVV